MNLSPGVIYIIKTNWGEVFEAEFVGKVQTAYVFSSLPWRSESPRFVVEEELEWFAPVCEMAADLTLRIYDKKICELNK